MPSSTTKARDFWDARRRGERLPEHELPVRAAAFTASFEPEGAPDGFVEWSFLVPREAALYAGVWELRFVRPLTKDERCGLTPAAVAADGSDA